MPTGNTSLLGLALPVQGELTGTWGDVVNQSITELVDTAVAGTTTLSTDTDVTLTTTALAANQARQAIILWTASNGATTRNITAPAQSKPYIVINAGTGSIVLRGAGPTTGITIIAGERCLAAWNGSDFVKVASSVITALTGTLPVANGGTGATSLTANNVILGNGTSAVQVVAPGTTGNVLTSNGTTWTSAVLPAGGLTYIFTTTPVTATDKQGVLTSTASGSFTVTLPASPATGAQVVVADAGSAWGTNNLTVARNGSTIGGLAENLICDITGASVQFVYDGTTWEVYAQIGGNGGNAVTLDGVQTLTNKTISFGSNTLTDVASTNTSQTLTNKTIAFGSNTLTNVASTNTVQTITGTKTFEGTSSTQAIVLNDAAEVATVSATAATGTIAYDITTQSVLFYTSNASANWTVNFRASSGTTLNTMMSTGQSMTAAFLVTQGSTAYFNSAVQVDGTTSGVTTRWQGGTAPAAGNASGVDIYTYTIIKTANATFSVFAAQTRFA
jgi:hypothetical protein